MKWRQRKEQIEKLKTKLNTLDQVEIWQEILQKSFEVKVIALSFLSKKNIKKKFPKQFSKKYIIISFKGFTARIATWIFEST